MSRVLMITFRTVLLVGTVSVVSCASGGAKQKSSASSADGNARASTDCGACKKMCEVSGGKNGGENVDKCKADCEAKCK